MFNKDEESRGTTLLYYNIAIAISITGSTLLGDSSSPILQSGSVPTHRSLLLGGLDSEQCPLSVFPINAFIKQV